MVSRRNGKPRISENEFEGTTTHESAAGLNAYDPTGRTTEFNSDGPPGGHGKIDLASEAPSPSGGESDAEISIGGLQ
jgi:hypothetical protein